MFASMRRMRSLEKPTDSGAAIARSRTGLSAIFMRAGGYQDLGAAETSADMVTSGAARRIRAPCVAAGVTIFGAPRARRRRIPWTPWTVWP